MSAMRQEIAQVMQKYRKLLKPDDKGWRVLEVGIDGDPPPGGNFRRFGTGNNYETLDILPRVKPTYVADIQDTKLEAEKFDIIICVQTLEHLYSPKKAIKEIFKLLKKGGYTILDNPWTYEYHPHYSYPDYWRISPSAMKRMMKEAGFEIIKCKLNKLLVTGLGRKPK